MNVGYDGDDLKPHIEPAEDYNDTSRIGEKNYNTNKNYNTHKPACLSPLSGALLGSALPHLASPCPAPPCPASPYTSL